MLPPILSLIFSPDKIFNFILKGFSFVVQHWKEVVAISAISLIFYQNFVSFEFLKWVGIRSIPGIEQEYEKKLDIKEQQLTECEASREVLKQQIDNTNAQIDQWASLSEQLQSQHTDLIEELEGMKKQSEQQVLDILEGPTPESCEAAIQFLRDAVKGDLKWSR